MSWHDAPLYVETHDLAVWVIERTSRWGQCGDTHLAPVVVEASSNLVVAASLALTFPHTRAGHLERVDETVVVLRILLRLAQRLGYLSSGGLRFACHRLEVIGRMVGGWRKRLAKAQPAVNASEDGPRVALRG